MITVVSRPRFGCYSPVRTGSAVQRSVTTSLSRDLIGQSGLGGVGAMSKALDLRLRKELLD